MDRLNSKLTLDGIDKEWVHKLRNIRSSASKLFSNVDLKNVKQSLKHLDWLCTVEKYLSSLSANKDINQ